jgi:hypothetical protein
LAPHSRVVLLAAAPHPSRVAHSLTHDAIPAVAALPRLLLPPAYGIVVSRHPWKSSIGTGDRPGAHVGPPPLGLV